MNKSALFYLDIYGDAKDESLLRICLLWATISQVSCVGDAFDHRDLLFPQVDYGVEMPYRIFWGYIYLKIPSLWDISLFLRIQSVLSSQLGITTRK